MISGMQTRVANAFLCVLSCPVRQHEQQLERCGWLASCVSEEACVSIHPPHLVAVV